MRSSHTLIFTTILLSHTYVNQGRKHNDIDYFLTKSGITKGKFNLKDADNGNLIATDLDDDGRDLMAFVRRAFFKYSNKHWPSLYSNNWRRGKIQSYRLQEDFPCKLNGTRSPEPPSSVDYLRPGDIDVIAAIGDSISAGSGILSKTFINFIAEFRGMAFTGGGIADWRTVLTLPNILKVFNPKLYGYSTANVMASEKDSHLNIAELMIMSRDLVYQVQVLIQRMKKDPHIDMKNHWKLLTIFVGSVDLCFDLCHHDNLTSLLHRHEIDLRDAFTLLRDNIPRLVVNLLPAADMVTTLYQRMKNVPLQCQMVHRFNCRCVFNESYNETTLRAASELFQRWQHIDEYVASLPEYQLHDFTVLYQPFTASGMLPTKTANGDYDLRLFSSDCFHFSQLGHASLANALWNNMLQGPGYKDPQVRKPFEKFECPTEDRPYIATFRNSFK